MTFSRILTEAHTQDFEKKRKVVDVPAEERRGTTGVSEGEGVVNSSDEEGSTMGTDVELGSEREEEDRQREINRLTSEREIEGVRRIVRGQNEEDREERHGAFRE